MNKLYCITLIIFGYYKITISSDSGKNVKSTDQETIALHEKIKKLVKEKKRFDRKMAKLEAEVAAYQQAFAQHGISLD